MNRDELILAKAKEIHKIVYELWENLQCDDSACLAVLELASVMYRHFGSPDGDNKGRTSAKMSKVNLWVPK